MQNNLLQHRTIALMAIPSMLLIGAFNVAHADNTQPGNWQKSEHYAENRGDNHRTMRATKKLNILSKKLALTAQQQTKIKALFQAQRTDHKAAAKNRKSLHQAIRNLDPNAGDYAQKLAQVKQQAGLAASQKIDDMLAMQQSMKKILTAEQLLKMQELRATGEGRRGMQHGLSLEK